jgi:hypothetical protein
LGKSCFKGLSPWAKGREGSAFLGCRIFSGLADGRANVVNLEVGGLALGVEQLAQSFSPNSARDGRQVCRPAGNFSVTKMQEEIA